MCIIVKFFLGLLLLPQHAAHNSPAVTVTHTASPAWSTQVLIDCIMQLEDVIQFRNRLDGQGQPATEPLEQQPGLLKQHSIHSSSSTNSSSRYVTSLLSKIPPQQVRDMLCWSSVDWMAEFTQSYERIPMLLDIVEREQAPEDTASYMSIVQQQLDEVS